MGADKSIDAVLIGGGPWAVFALERLISRFRPLTQVKLTVNLIDDGNLGSGPSFHPNLPEYALLNFPVGHVEPWKDEGSSVLPKTFSSLRDWLGQRNPERAIDPASCVPRSVVGEYFKAVLYELGNRLPPHIRLRRIEDRVTDVRPRDRGWRIELLRGQALEADAVLLATGVPYDAPLDNDSAETLDFAARHGLIFYENRRSWSDLNEIRAGEPIAIKGQGLTFIDLVLALTEGRGGRFVESETGLRYLPSGDEPRPIFPFSRTGLFYAPKSVGDWPHRERYRPWSLTDADVRELLARGTPLDFDRDLLPRIEREMCAQYLSVGARLGQRLPPPLLSRLVHPTSSRATRSGPAFRTFATDMLKMQLDWARAGIERSAQRAVIEVWSRLFPRICELVSFGGLTAASHRRFEKTLRPGWGRLAFGPPIVNARKVLAIIEAGWIDLRLAAAGRIALDERRGTFRLRSAAIREPEISVRQLIDARVPKFSLDHGPPPLYARLAWRGSVRPFVNRNGGEHGTGAVEVDRRTRAIRSNGRPSRGLCVIGAPTEGCVIGTDSLPAARTPWAEEWAESVVRLVKETQTFKPQEVA